MGQDAPMDVHESRKRHIARLCFDVHDFVRAAEGPAVSADPGADRTGHRRASRVLERESDDQSEGFT